MVQGAWDTIWTYELTCQFKHRYLPGLRQVREGEAGRERREDQERGGEEILWRRQSSQEGEPGWSSSSGNSVWDTTRFRSRGEIKMGVRSRKPEHVSCIYVAQRSWPNDYRGGQLRRALFVARQQG